MKAVEVEPKGHAICKNFISFITHLIGEGGFLYLWRGFVRVASRKANSPMCVTYYHQAIRVLINSLVEKEMATQSSILAWEILWTLWAAVHGVAKESDTT